MKSKLKVVVVNKTTNHVVRGGRRFNRARACYSAYRVGYPEGIFDGNGFRLVKPIKKAR